MQIQRARCDDFADVMEVLAESIRWLRSRGLDQWSTWRTWRTKMRPSLERGDVWLLLDGEHDLVGTITVEFHGDPDFWTRDELATPAAYVSKLAVRRAFAGRELGTLLLDWAGDLAYRRGCDWVRLDAWKSNEQLHAYYRDRSWTYLRTATNPRRRSGALFQRPARPLSRDAAQLLPEVPVPLLDTRFQTTPDVDNLSGTWMPQHTHAGGLRVDYRHAGPSSALFVAFMRYRVRQEDSGEWVLEAKMDGPHSWERHGRVLTANWPLVPGTTYVITHQEGTPCAMTITEVPTESRHAA